MRSLWERDRLVDEEIASLPASLRSQLRLRMTKFMDFYEYCRKTAHTGGEARTELNRGFTLADEHARSLERMANRWDAARVGKEANWWPIPSGW